MARPERIEPQEAHDEARRGAATIVCAYEDEEKCGTMPIAGAIPLARLERTEDEVPKDRGLVFY